MPLKPGDVLDDRYEVVRAVQSGGMGAVYECLDKRLDGTPCALKEMLGQFVEGEDSGTVKRKFAEEVQVLSRCLHPAIPRIRDSFLIGEIRYIVMDFIPGQNLEDELRDYLALTGRPVPPERLVSDAIQVLEVLEYIHDKKPPILHRDVKPPNLIRQRGDGRIKLVDFGLARPMDEGLATHTLVGTLAYCSPEQVQGRADRRSDVYSLGATMYHLLSGKAPRPLSGESVLEAIPDTDPALARLVDRARAIRPEDRFQCAAEMRVALAGWLESRARQAALVPVEPVEAAPTAPTVPFVEGEITEPFRAASTVPMGRSAYSRIFFGAALSVPILVLVLLIGMAVRAPMGPDRPQAEVSAIDSVAIKPSPAADEPAPQPTRLAAASPHPAASPARLEAASPRPAASPARLEAKSPRPAASPARPEAKPPRPADPTSFGAKPTRPAEKPARAASYPTRTGSKPFASTTGPKTATLPGHSYPVARDPAPPPVPDVEEGFNLHGLVFIPPPGWEREHFDPSPARTELRLRAHGPHRRIVLVVETSAHPPPAPDVLRSEMIHGAERDGFTVFHEEQAPVGLVLWLEPRGGRAAGIGVRVLAVTRMEGQGFRVARGEYRSQGDPESSKGEALKFVQDLGLAARRL
ncbi:MAG: protein kinase [Armatimonadetes bacterium]|nr:protein kinase [Armatimonadota bacterium]